MSEVVKQVQLHVLRKFKIHRRLAINPAQRLVQVPKDWQTTRLFKRFKAFINYCHDDAPPRQSHKRFDFVRKYKKQTDKLADDSFQSKVGPNARAYSNRLSKFKPEERYN